MKEEEKHRYASLDKILPQKLDTIISYVDLHSAKKFIKTNSTSYLTPVLFVKKPGREIRFYFDNQKLDAITNKNWYLISLIEDTFT